jgi:hypothetical protein
MDSSHAATVCVTGGAIKGSFYGLHISFFLFGQQLHSVHSAEYSWTREKKCLQNGSYKGHLQCNKWSHMNTESTTDADEGNINMDLNKIEYRSADWI